MAGIMENLIEKKYYKTREEVDKKLNVFYAFNVITEEDYTRLMELANTKYEE